MGEVKFRVNWAPGFVQSNREGQLLAGRFGNLFGTAVPSMRNSKSVFTQCKI